jgi:ABC-type multidrug transport system ATPase subunit
MSSLQQKAEMFRRILAHFNEEGKTATVLIVTSDLDSARETFTDFLDMSGDALVDINMGQLKARHIRGGSLSVKSIKIPHAFAGPQWSRVDFVRDYNLHAILNNLEDIKLGLRLGKEPKMYTWLIDSEDKSPDTGKV